MWETTYLHVLDPEGAQESPVLEWTKGTALRPVLQVLTDERERAAFLSAYARRLAQAYPRQPFGTVFPFRRIFAVAQRPGIRPERGAARRWPAATGGAGRRVSSRACAGWAWPRGRTGRSTRG